MYCTKCGKEIDYDAPVCDECVGKSLRKSAATTSEFYATAASGTNYSCEPQTTVTVVDCKTPDNDTGSNMFRFGKCLTSAIFGTLSILLYSILICSGVEVLMIFSAILGYGMGIPALAVGIPSIVSVSKHIKRTGVFPYAPFALCIAGTILGCLGFAAVGMTGLSLM